MAKSNDSEAQLGNTLFAGNSGEVHSSEGWEVRPIGRDFLEYIDGPDACVINVGAGMPNRARPIYASEASSEFFPNLREHLMSALPFLRGLYVIV